MGHRTLYKTLLGTIESPVSKYGSHRWEIGKWYKRRGKIKLCCNGFHASMMPADTLCFVKSDLVAKVEVRGKGDKGFNKECWSEMRIIKIIKIDHTDAREWLKIKLRALIDEFGGKHKGLLHKAMKLAENRSRRKTKWAMNAKIFKIEDTQDVNGLWRTCTAVRGYLARKRDGLGIDITTGKRYIFNDYIYEKLVTTTTTNATKRSA